MVLESILQKLDRVVYDTETMIVELDEEKFEKLKKELEKTYYLAYEIQPTIDSQEIIIPQMTMKGETKKIKIIPHAKKESING